MWTFLRCGIDICDGPSRAHHTPFLVNIHKQLQADQYNHVIRRVSITSGDVTTLAGSGIPGSSNGASATAKFQGPYGVAMDSNATFALVVSG